MAPPSRQYFFRSQEIRQIKPQKKGQKQILIKSQPGKPPVAGISVHSPPHYANQEKEKRCRRLMNAAEAAAATPTAEYAKQ